MISEYEMVKLAIAVDNVPISIGTKGVVLMIYPDKPTAYEIEFFGENGRSLGCYTVQADFVDLDPMN